MTDDLDALLATTEPATETARSVVRERPAPRPVDPARARRNRNNGKRGRAAELDAARWTGGRKVGPMGWPWDVELPGYARVQVRKLATPPSLREVIKALDAIARTPGPEMAAYLWIEPGRGGERLVITRLRDWQEHHGPVKEEAA